MHKRKPYCTENIMHGRKRITQKKTQCTEEKRNEQKKIIESKKTYYIKEKVMQK